MNQNTKLWKTFAETVTENLARPFAVTGRRGYLIGLMNGSFPDMGVHLPGEMGGLWTPPVKLADGFWFGLSLAGRSDATWLYGEKCRSFTMQAGSVVRQFAVELNGHKFLAEQEIFMPENEPASIITLTLTNQALNPLDLTLSWLTRFDIQGAWWSDWADRPDVARFDRVSGAIVAWDSLHTEWNATMVSDLTPSAHEIGVDLWAGEQTRSLNGVHHEDEGLLSNPQELQGQGISGKLNYQLKLGANESQTFTFVIAGNTNSAEESLKLAQTLLTQNDSLKAQKLTRLATLIQNTPLLHTSRPDFDRLFVPSALCMDMLTQDLPAVGRGIMAGLQGFAWFFGCDTYYTLGGLLISGQNDTALAMLKILADYARKQGGRVPHEITQTGRLFNSGNTVETPQFVLAVERAYRWTGDLAFLHEVYPVCKQGIFDYVLGECDPNNTLLPDGAGLLELRTAEHGKKLDVACALYDSLHGLAYLAEVMQEEAIVTRCRELAVAVKERIERYFWVESRQEYVWRIEPDLTAVAGEPAHTYAVLELGVLDHSNQAKITKLFETVESPAHTGAKGVIHPGTTDFVMPIQNAIVAQAEFRYNRPDKALWYIERCAELSGYYMPWAIPEFVGKNACFLQAWSSATFNWLSVQGFFRLNPDPLKKIIYVQPQLPKDWDFLAVSNLNLWGNFYDLRLERKGLKLEFSAKLISQTATPLSFEVITNPPLPVRFS